MLVKKVPLSDVRYPHYMILQYNLLVLIRSVSFSCGFTMVARRHSIPRMDKLENCLCTWIGVGFWSVQNLKKNEMTCAEYTSTAQFHRLHPHVRHTAPTIHTENEKVTTRGWFKKLNCFFTPAFQDRTMNPRTRWGARKLGSEINIG